VDEAFDYAFAQHRAGRPGAPWIRMDQDAGGIVLAAV
jgi:hypothetical protein